MDDIPLPLAPALAGPRTAAMVLSALEAPCTAASARRRHDRRIALRIVGGTVHDPANGVDGEVRDICIDDGRIVADLPAGAPTLDARGMVVMPGGVDIHCHFASSSCNHARRLLPEEHAADPVPAPAPRRGGRIGRSGTGGTVPSTFTTGYRYAGLGYTTVFDAAVAPLHGAAQPRGDWTTRPAWMAASSCSWGTTSTCCARSRPASATGLATTPPGCSAPPAATRSRS